MSFYHRYELVKLVNNGDPKSFEAREIQTGQSVLLHLWSMGGDSSSASLLVRMRSLASQQPAAVAGRLIEVQESAQPPYAVTALESGFVSLESWLGSFAATAQPAHPQPPAADLSTSGPSRPASLAGPTVDMPITARPLSPQAPPATPPPHFQPPAPAPVSPPAQAVGEFTQMFQGSIAQPPVRPSTPPPPPSPSAAGSFTPSPAPAAAEQGEFTRLFASPSQPASPPQPAQSAGPGPLQAPQPPAPSEMGEFTRLFASPSPAPSAPPQASAPPAPAQSFTPLASPEFAPAPPPLATPPHPLFPAPAPQPIPAALDPSPHPLPPFPPSTPAPSPASGSGFTGMFGGPVQQPSSPAPPFGAPASPASQSGLSDFEKFFANPLGASPVPLEEIERGRMAAPTPPPSAKPFRGPGDFTLQFGRDAAKPASSSGPELSYSPPPAPTPQARMSSGATGIFSAPSPDYGPGFDSPAAPSGPGEFTRIIQGPPKQSDSPAPAPAQFAPPPSAVAAPVPQTKSKLTPVLLAVLSVVVVALLITVVILLFRK